MNEPQHEEEQQSLWRSYSAPAGMALLVVVVALLAWNDRRAVDAVNSSHRAAKGAQEAVAQLAQAKPNDAAFAAVKKEVDAILTSEGGALATPMFGLLGRGEIQRGARTNRALALALLAQLDVIKGDLDAAAKAAQRYEEETKDDLVPGDVEALVWRVAEIAEHPEARGLDRTRRCAALYAKKSLSEFLQESAQKKTD